MIGPIEIVAQNRALLNRSNSVISLNEVSIYPNPTSIGYFNVDLSGTAPLKSVIFDDELRNGFNNWSWNVTSTIIDTEFTEGTKALKVEYQSDGGLKLANSTLSTEGMSELVFSIYGGEGLGNSSKLSLMVNNKYGALDVQTVQGKWVEFAIPFSELTDKGVPDLDKEFREMALQNTSGYFIIDKIGLR